jgi:hypothetical protein
VQGGGRVTALTEIDRAGQLAIAGRLTVDHRSKAPQLAKELVAQGR